MNDILSGLTSDAYGLGSLYKPKTQRLTVGIELSPISASYFNGGVKNKDYVVADGDDVRFDSYNVFNSAKRAAQKGFQVKNFRHVDLEKYGAAEQTPLYENDKYRIDFSENALVINEKDEAGNILQDSIRSFQITGNTRLSWDENNELVVFSGADSLTEGKLQAVNDNEILIRKTGVDVKAGNNTTVLNLSDQSGTFSGGGNVTYLGSYGKGSTIESASGKTTYAGYFADMELVVAEGNGVFSGVFENSKITGNLADEFSGYFSSSEINGGKGAHIFKGMFINNSVLNGGEGNDLFNGRYVNAKISGGDGDDSFGNGNAEKNEKSLFSLRYLKNYTGIAADFIDSDVDAGKGKDKFDGVMSGGALSLGEDEDTVSGVFVDALVDGRDGDDEFAVTYSSKSSFELGGGDNTAVISTAEGSLVRSGDGRNNISMGHNRGTSEDGTGRFNSTWGLYREKRFESGELSSNEVDATQGENAVTIHNGAGVNAINPENSAPEEESGTAMAPGAQKMGARQGDSAREKEGAPADGEADSANAIGKPTERGSNLDAREWPVAAMVRTEEKELIIRALDRSNFERKHDKNETFGRVIRRADGFGGYNWVKSST